MAMSGMRGLSVFISDIRNCQNKEQERLRVDKELGNIRTRFKNEKVRLGFLFFLSASLLTSIATSCCCFFHHFSRILLLEFDFSRTLLFVVTLRQWKPRKIEIGDLFIALGLMFKIDRGKLGI